MWSIYSCYRFYLIPTLMECRPAAAAVLDSGRRILGICCGDSSLYLTHISKEWCMHCYQQEPTQQQCSICSGIQCRSTFSDIIIDNALLRQNGEYCVGVHYAVRTRFLLNSLDKCKKNIMQCQTIFIFIFLN